MTTPILDNKHHMVCHSNGFHSSVFHNSVCHGNGCRVSKDDTNNQLEHHYYIEKKYILLTIFSELKNSMQE